MNSKPDLTERQELILNFIKEEIEMKGYPPSVREIGHAVGLKSSSSVHSQLVRLEEKGLLKRDPTKPRALTLTATDSPEKAHKSMELPVIGNVAAGAPILAEQNIDDYFWVPTDFIGQGTHFILKVKGDSMIDAGIFDGDYLIVRHQKDAANGEIVVAIVENEATVKRFYRKSGYIELRPENNLMQPFILKDVQIAGKVTGLLRKI